MATTTENEIVSQSEVETALIAILKRMAIRRGGSLGKAAQLHEGKVEWKFIRAGYDSRTARLIVEGCVEVALNEAAIELGK